MAMKLAGPPHQMTCARCVVLPWNIQQRHAHGLISHVQLDDCDSSSVAQIEPPTTVKAFSTLIGACLEIGGPLQICVSHRDVE